MIFNLIIWSERNIFFTEVCSLLIINKFFNIKWVFVVVAKLLFCRGHLTILYHITKSNSPSSKIAFNFLTLRCIIIVITSQYLEYLEAKFIYAYSDTISVEIGWVLLKLRPFKRVHLSIWKLQESLLMFQCTSLYFCMTKMPSVVLVLRNQNNDKLITIVLCN